MEHPSTPSAGALFAGIIACLLVALLGLGLVNAILGLANLVVGWL